MKELIEFIARALVDAPDEVQVTEVPGRDGEPGSVLELRVGRDDLGKVIGRQGRTARALRTLLSAAASKQQARIVLEIVEQ
jgi:predicted RNA-binding protein YlqC (UPF0109 family)